MDAIKKTGIMAGAIAGGAIGGTISFIGKLANVKIVDDIGASISNSLIFTGSMVGDVASGATDMISGKVNGDEEKADEGWSDVKGTGKQVVSNFVNNVSLIAGSGGKIARGAIHLDGEEIKEGAKSLVKIAAVGALTVGAIKLTDTEKK